MLVRSDDGKKQHPNPLPEVRLPTERGFAAELWDLGGDPVRLAKCLLIVVSGQAAQQF